MKKEGKQARKEGRKEASKQVNAITLHLQQQQYPHHKI